VHIGQHHVVDAARRWAVTLGDGDPGQHRNHVSHMYKPKR
jgi:hypothetical protein